MKNWLFGSLILGASIMHPMGAFAIDGDSVGTKVVNGKSYVLLKITKGDNLSAIARTYNASVPFIKELNKMPNESIQIGQVIMVPSRSKATTESLGSVSKPVQTEPAPAPAPATPQPVAPAPKPVAVKPASAGDPQKHKVESGESLFAVARKYNVSVDQIKKWNNLQADGLRVGQVLIVSDPGNSTASTNNTNGANSVTNNAAANNNNQSATAATPSGNEPGVHVVRQGETLYGIARIYGMDARDLKVLNKIEDPNLKIGQVLRVKMDPPANPNQGMGLMDMLDEKKTDSAGVKELYPDLKVLTVPANTMVAPEAKVTVYKDKSSGKSYKRVEESGTVGLIDDFITDQTKFYAFHSYLPVGSYIRIDYPDKGQSILAEVTSQLPSRDPNVVRLSAKCLDYLMIRKPGAQVVVRYVIPMEN